MSKSENKVTISIESVTVIRILALVIASLLVLTFLRNITHIITLILVSVFLAIALNPAVSGLSHRLRIKSRVKATALAFVLVVTFLVTFISLIFPPLVRQTVDFVADVPSALHEVQNEDKGIGRFIHRYNLDEEIDQLAQDYGSRFSDLGKPALATAGKIGSTVISIITVLVLTFMMLVEGPTWIERYYSLHPARRRDHHKKLALRMYQVVVSYVNGQVIIAALGGTFATIALFITSQIFDAPINALALGGIVALFALMPMIGTIIGSVLVVLSCLFVSFPLAIAMTVYFVVYQQIENVTIQPYVQARSNNLTPLIVFLAALLGIGLGGILGAFLAIPAAGCIKVLIDDYYGRKTHSKAKLPKA